MNKYPFKSTSIDSEKKINLEKGIIPFVLTSKTVDRDSEVILPDGGDVEEFKSNPVFLWAHDMWSPAIGKVLTDTIKTTKQKMTADVQFDMNDPFAELVFNKYKDGFLSAGSIRFRPTSIGTEPVLPGQKGVTIEKWKLLEFSAVPVPANPQALAQIQKSLEDVEDERAKDWVADIKAALETNAEEIPKDDAIIVTATKMPEGFEEFRKDVLQEVTEGIGLAFRTAMNPLLRDEFQYKNDNGEADYIMLANAMINLFHNKTLPDYQRKYVYNHLAEQYKQFDKKPPEFNEEPKKEQGSESDQDFTIDNDSVNNIINTVVQSIKG
jgi:phage head maturation protease